MIKIGVDCNRMENKKKKWRVFAFVPMFCMMFIIWGFSSNNGDNSASQSLEIVNRLITAGERISGHILTEEDRMMWEERIHTPIRKLAHMTEYMIFTLTVAFPLMLYCKDKKKIKWITFIYCTLYACLDEIHQLFVPERSGQITDVLIDAVGIGVGLFIFRKCYGRIHFSET